MPRTRDVMRNRIIEAENRYVSAKGLKAQNLPTLQGFARSITQRAWWKKQKVNSSAPLTVEFDTRRSNYSNGCCPSGMSILVDSNSSTRLHVLHSMAHILLMGQKGNHQHGEPMHGVDFVQVYLELVRRYIDPTMQINDMEKRNLKACFLDAKVKTKTVSDATREKQRAAAVVKAMPTREDLLATLAGIKEIG